MALGTDGVRVTKVEGTDTGGDALDDGVYGSPTPIDTQEDYIVSAGVVMHDASNTGTSVYMAREGDDLIFRDVTVGATKTLTELLAGGAHAANHIKDGSDEIDGDQLDIDFNPSSYTPDTSIAEATDADHLAAHLAGIDKKLDKAKGSGSFFFATLSADQTTNLGNGNQVEWNTDSGSAGSDITLDITTNVGRFTLKAGKTYKLSAQVRAEYSASSGSSSYRWRDITGSADLGLISNGRPQNSTVLFSENPIVMAVFTPTVDSEVELQRWSGSSLSTIQAVHSWAKVEVIHGNGIPVTDFLFAKLSADQSTNLTVGDQIQFDTIDISQGSNISLDTTTNVGRFTLTAGHTYRIQCGVRPDFSAPGGAFQMKIRNVTDSVDIGIISNQAPYTRTSDVSHQDMVIGMVTPETNIECEIQVVANVSVSDIEYLYSYLHIESLGAYLAEKSFVLADLTGNQTTGLTVGSPVQLDRDLYRQGQDIAAVSSNSWVLKAGRAYLLSADCSVTFSASNGVMTYHWYDLTGSAQLGLGGAKRPHTFSSNFDETERCIAVFEPTVDSTVELRITANTSLSVINAGFTQATLETIDGVPGGGALHAATHILGGVDEIDGDKLDIDFTPSNYTPSTSPAEVDNLDHLTAHLAGIDTALASAGGSSPLTTKGDLYTYDTGDQRLGVGSNDQILIADSAEATGLKWGAVPLHAATHILGGTDEIDGDQIDIDFTPANYTPDTAPAEVTDVDHLSAHLKGIDTALASTGSHASTHITGGGDEIDGDQLDIDFTPALLLRLLKHLM